MIKGTAAVEFFTDFSKAWGELRNPPKDSKVDIPGKYSFKYSDLATVFDSVKETLTKHGFSISQIMGAEENRFGITTILGHKSGQFLTSFIPLSIENAAPKEIGTTITYMRRYAITALLGIAADEDKDDPPLDPDKNSENNKKPETGNPGAQKPPPVKPQLTVPQVNRLFAIAKSRGWTLDQVREFSIKLTGKSEPSQLSRQEYDEIIKYIQGGDFRMATEEVERFQIGMGK